MKAMASAHKGGISTHEKREVRRSALTEYGDPLFDLFSCIEMSCKDL